MPEPHASVQQIIDDLEERAKELDCLYRLGEALSSPLATLPAVLEAVVRIIPPGWQYPEVCQARIALQDALVASPGFRETPWAQEAEIVVRGERVGKIEVCYTEPRPPADEGPFLKEERKLIDTIADRLAYCVTHRELVRRIEEWQAARQAAARRTAHGEWGVVLDLLRQTDQNLLMRIARKMINHLCWKGVAEAEDLLRHLGAEWRGEEADLLIDANQPREKQVLPSIGNLSEQAFSIAARHLSEDEIAACLQKWIREDRSSFLVNTLENLDAPLPEIGDAMARYRQMAPEEREFSAATEKALRVALIRRFFSDQLQFINVAKRYVEINDFHDIFQRMIFPQGSRGRLGGKSSGLFVASRIIRRSTTQPKLLGDIKVPKTWYVVSDGLRNFIYRNNLEDVLNQKYKELERVRQEYPHIMQVFKNSSFSPEVIKGLSMALDEFGDRPLIVRSSSLLEDRFGTAFCGKYLSLFLANRGPKVQRLAALTDAMAEVYASTFSPDPIEYRGERGLLDFHEEMGLLIQEVVGTRVGRYFLPAYSGVAFSHNEFRWSPRIRRNDGLIRLVPGLGTRAVDRLGDDYPVLLAPGQPGLRVNMSVDEIVRYAPRMVDVINLETECFETVAVRDLLRTSGAEYPGVEQLVSVLDQGHLRRPVGRNLDFERDDLVVTFDGLIGGTPFTQRIRGLLQLLEEKLGTPVDVEFASDGTDLFLLQCRPQSHASHSAPVPIPRDLPRESIVFSAKRYVSNGRVPDLTHVVYVDPDGYQRLSDLSELVAIGRTVGKLNKLLPRRQFLLMGPGRWGSRGDIKLGVKVTYSDINNAAALIEVARRRGNYVPDLSFGTHFFQDLVEASIQYLPLYPDEPGVIFNERFFNRARNLLAEVLPEAAALADTVRVIDVREASGGKVLRLLTNADLDEAVAILVRPAGEVPNLRFDEPPAAAPSEDHWCWRLRMAERLAAQLDPAHFGVKALYVFGSTKNACAGAGSDINLLVHFAGTPEQQAALLEWLRGWSLCLSEMNYLRTGYRTDGLLDVHLVTDEDLAARTSYAVKIDAITDPARPLPLLGAAAPPATGG